MRSDSYMQAWSADFMSMVELEQARAICCLQFVILYLELGRRAIKVSLLELLDAPIEAITSLEFYRNWLLLDDIDAISGVPHWKAVSI